MPRLAILPITSFRHLKGESEIVMFTNQIRDWVHKHPDTWVYMILPEDCRDQGWEGTQFPRTTVLWIDRLGLYYDKLTDLPATFLEAFNLRIGKYQIDALITSRRATVIGMARELWDHRMKTSIPIFVDESMTVERGKTPSAVSDLEMMAASLGYAYGFPIFDTEDQLINARSAARHFLSGAGALKVLEKAVIIPCGFEPDRTDRALAGVDITKNDRFTCFFGGRLNRGSKRADIMLREYDSFFKFGRDVDVTVCSPKDEGWILEMIEKDYPEIQVLVQTPSDEFKQRAAKAHVFLNTSAHEGFSVGFCEMMYMTKYGTVLIAPRLPWVKGMFKEKFEEYPFLYEDFEQARVMLRWVHENYDEAVAKTKWLGDWVRDQYDALVTNEEHWQHYDQTIGRELSPELIRGLMSPSNQELTLATLDKMGTEFSIEEFYAQMIEDSRAMKEEPRRGQTTKWAIRRWLMQEGKAVDTYDSAETRMRNV
jgi:hypothetical protein